MAAVSGTTNTSSRTKVITTTARLRLPHRRPWMRSIKGHVATTTVAAQMLGPRKGRSTHSAVPMSKPRHSTAKVVRVKSRGVLVMKGGGAWHQRLSE